MITTHHIIIKNLLQVHSIIKKKEIQPQIDQKIKRSNDWVILDLELFDNVIIDEFKYRITFLFKEFKQVKRVFFSLKEETSEFESAVRNLDYLSDKKPNLKTVKMRMSEYETKRLKKRQERILGDKYVPLVGNLSDYMSRGPWEFYSWGRVGLGILFYLVLTPVLSLPGYTLGLNPKGLWGLQFLEFIFSVLLGAFFLSIESYFFYSNWRLNNRSPNYARLDLFEMIFISLGALIMLIIQSITMLLLSTPQWIFFFIAGIIFIFVNLFYCIGYFYTNNRIRKSEAEKGISSKNEDTLA